MVVDGFWIGETQYDDNAIIANGMFTYGGWAGMLNPGSFLGGYRISHATNSFVKFSFDGVQLTWTAARGPAYGKASIYIDGVLVRTVDFYRASQEWQYQVTISGLAYGNHIVVIKVLGQKDPASSGTGIVIDLLGIE